VITQVGTRQASDSILGVPGMLYDIYGTWDLGFGDFLTLSANRQTLSMSGGATAATDQIRIITASASPPPIVDPSPPTTTALLSPLPNPAGWHNSDVTLTLNALDEGGSGTQQLTYSATGAQPLTPTTVEGASAAFTLTAEGLTTITFSARDNAGNVEAPQSLTVRIDKTPPTISGSPSPAANAAGWNNSNVTVSFTCQDALSGVATCTDPVTLTTDGANQTITGTATDQADNSASFTVSGINIDQTPPVVSLLSRLPAANAFGWNNTDVTASFQASDTLSGVEGEATATVVLSQEGANLTASHRFQDRAGNSATATESGIKIDKTPPALTPARPPASNANGWNNTEVTVSFTCEDPLSGVESCPAPTTLTSEGANQSVTGTATDRAGNAASVTVNGINIDKTPPNLTFDPPSPAANAAGWNNADVAVSFTASDSLSGVASSSPASPLLLTTDGSGLTGMVTVTDQAGNVASFTSPPVQIDKTPPTVTYTGNTGSYTVDQVVSISCSASDNLSGVAAHTCQDIGGFAGTFALGLNTFSATARDQAGNGRSGSTSFTVVVTEDSLAKLTEQFVSHAGILNSLRTKLEQGNYAAYIYEVEAQRGKTIREEHAEILLRLARAL
jgi:hypothetical protein